MSPCAHDRRVSRTCIHSVTDCDEIKDYDIAPSLACTNLTYECDNSPAKYNAAQLTTEERNEAFKKQLKLRATELYLAIITDEQFKS